jgi:predicted enzyme related to lactoylglutathione lyase
VGQTAVVARPQNPSGIAWAAVTLDCRSPERIATFWGALLELPVRSERDGWSRIEPAVPGGPVINFQPVIEDKHGKVRLHLDLWVDDLDAATQRVESLGGSDTRQRDVVANRGTIAVMADPEGHEFCLISGT